MPSVERAPNFARASRPGQKPPNDVFAGRARMGLRGLEFAGRVSIVLEVAVLMCRGPLAGCRPEHRRTNQGTVCPSGVVPTTEDRVRE
jgi:hypothetical protein